MGLSSVQKGNIIESQVANMLILLSDGELTPSIPLVDDYGVDMIISAKGTFNTVFVQVKSRFVTNTRYKNRVDFQIQKESIKKSTQLYVLLVYFDRPKAQIDTMWLIPAVDVIGGAVSLKKHYRIAASKAEKSKDKWARFRATPQKLVDILVSQLTGRWR